MTGAGEENHWSLPIANHIIGHRGSLFGGAGLAAGILALEEAAGKPVVWATGQFLAPTQGDITLDLAVKLPAVGRSVTQGRVLGKLDGHEIITILGAAGKRPNRFAQITPTFPAPPTPLGCPVMERDSPSSMHNHVETRIARGMFGWGARGTPHPDSMQLWLRLPEVEHDAAALAILADYNGGAIGNALGHAVGSTSLDNTIRYAAPVTDHPDDEWVLCDSRAEFVGNGFGMVTSQLWNQRGDLLAVASQSMIVREMPTSAPSAE